MPKNVKRRYVDEEANASNYPEFVQGLLEFAKDS